MLAHITCISLILSFILILHSPVNGAPLFEDTPTGHWARDAVANLASRGLVEGYPDGMFNGARAASRYEMAMVVARFLAKNDQEHGAFATKAELMEVKKLSLLLKDEMEALGVRVANLEEEVRKLDMRVTEKERITFEGDFGIKYVNTAIRNIGTTAPRWSTDVGTPNGVNFNQGFKFGTIDLQNGRPFVNGAAMDSRMRLGVKAKLSDDLFAGVRFAGYSSVLSPYNNAYWGIPAPYLSNNFAGTYNNAAGARGMDNIPWTRLTLDSLIVESQKKKYTIIVGSINDTIMDNFILAKIPNPNICGKSMARFSERIVTDRKKEEVITLKYHEDEDTCLPFYGAQAGGKVHIFGPVEWEAMASKLPFGANPTAGSDQPVPNDMTTPEFVSLTTKWSLGDRGSFKLNYLKASEDMAGVRVPNHGNYWFWTDPLSYAGTPLENMPMRGSAFISLQSQNSYGASLNYRLDPGCVRFVLTYGGTDYKPNVSSSYAVKGNHYRAGIGWTNMASNLRVNAEYLSTDPFYDPFQLYFQPLESMTLGGVPPGTPIAFSVVPAYYGGFPGSYAPFAYQLHDSGIYPNNRQGYRLAGEFLFPKRRGRIGLRYAALGQCMVSAPQQDITGFYRGMTPGFIDPVFQPLRTNGQVINETPRGSQYQAGGTISYRWPKLMTQVQYDNFAFYRSSGYAPATETAKRNVVNLGYNVWKIDLEYPLNEQLTLRGGYDYTIVAGYHPTTNILFDAPANTKLLDISQSSPRIGFDCQLSRNTLWKLDGRLIENIDHATGRLSPESFAGSQVSSEFTVKF